MRRVIRQFITLAVLTALENLRQPLTLLLATSGVAGMTLLPLITTQTLGESAQMIADGALAFHFFFGLLLAGIAACQSLTHEIRRGTAATVLSKPVGRELFLLAKFAGVAMVMLYFSALATISSMLSARAAAEAFQIDWWGVGPLAGAIVLAYLGAGLVNYFTRRPFNSDAAMFLLIGVMAAFTLSSFVSREGEWTAGFGSAFRWGLVPVNALVAMGLLVLAAIATALATRLTLVPTVSICSLLFLGGLMSDYLLGRHAATSRAAAALYAVFPNWQHFWVVDALHLDQPVPMAYVRGVALYALFYLIGILALGIVSFRHVEIKS